MTSTAVMILAAVAPAVILALLMMRNDRGEPEPKSALLLSALAGMVAAGLSIAAVYITLPDFEVDTAAAVFVDAFCHAAIPEECFKLLMLYLIARFCESFNEYFDGIIYSVCIAMGFAAVENVLYLFEAGSQWFVVGALRALVSVPGHYFFAIIMGAYFSLTWFDTRHRVRNAFLALILPLMAHGIFDALLLSVPAVDYGSPVIFILFIIFYNRLRRYAASLVVARLADDEILPLPRRPQ